MHPGERSPPHLPIPGSPKSPATQATKTAVSQGWECQLSRLKPGLGRCKTSGRVLPVPRAPNAAGRGRSTISWTGALEARFLKALQQAGGVWVRHGPDVATPRACPGLGRSEPSGWPTAGRQHHGACGPQRGLDSTQAARLISAITFSPTALGRLSPWDRTCSGCRRELPTNTHPASPCNPLLWATRVFYRFRTPPHPPLPEVAPPPPIQEAKPKAILQRMGAYSTQLTTIQVSGVEDLGSRNKQPYRRCCCCEPGNARIRLLQH